MKRLVMRFGILCVFLSMLTANYSTAADQLYVYQDKDSQEYLWVPCGWMPDGHGISFKDNFTKDCYNKSATCIKIGFSAEQAVDSWVGIYWLPQKGKKCLWEGPGFNIYEKLGVDEGTPIKLTFWARGATGDEWINFKVGGVGDGNDSIAFAIDTGWEKLEKNWKPYEIELSKKDLSNVVGGFCWVTDEEHNPEKNEVWFYLDEIKYEIGE